MELLGFEELSLRPSPIAYRRTYDVKASIRIRSGPDLLCSAVVQLEEDALGTSTVSVSLVGTPNAPVIPVVRCIRDAVVELKKQGELP